MPDYKKLGLRVGLELHQQLNSGHKLFCNCPVLGTTTEGRKAASSEEFPVKTRRKLRAVPSELGEYDVAAEYEYLRNRTFVYLSNPESSCLVELDEFPPLSINENALKTSIQLAKLLHADIVNEIHVMRKTVIDGSAVTGFQRTALIATNGYIDTPERLEISTINLEEDSAPAMSKGDIIEYRLDRLGTPLVEIATGSTISSPEQAKEAAEKIGSLLRSLDVVRGLGSIRQDVNVSISQGSRVEIKGFQQLEDIPKLVENEVKRQQSLLEVRDELNKRGFRAVKPDMKDVTELFQNTKCNFVKKSVEEGSHVSALVVPKFSGLLKTECGDRTFGKELSAYPASYGFGIIHSDEDLQKYNLTADFQNLRKELNANDEDLVMIVVGNGSERAIDALLRRINYCLIGVPEETRIADGIGSKYARPLPGSGRLYPESDVPAIKITKQLLNIEVPKTLDEYYRETITEVKNEQLTKQIVRSKYYSWFIELKKHDPVLAATIFLSTYKDLSRRGFDVNKITDKDLDILLKNVSSGKIPKNAIINILEMVCSGTEIESAMKNYKQISNEDLKSTVRAVIADNQGKSQSAIIGIVMEKTKGRADGRKVSELVKEFAK